MQPTEPRAWGENPSFSQVLENLSLRLREAFARDSIGPIEQLVRQAPPEFHDHLFEQLVIEEIQLRLHRGETPNREQYRIRFPERPELVDKAWQAVELHELVSTADRKRDSSQSMLTGTDRLEVAAAVPQKLGPYKLMRPLGAGTFGSVYKAEHESSGKVVAVKMLKTSWARDPECGQAMRHQFAEEAKMMLQFDHPHVVKVISLDDRADPPYFVQEFIDGETLANRLQTSRPSVELAVKYAIQIAAGLAHIHSRERWHRDLKPANILIDRNNHVYLADFGLALEDAQRWRTSRGPAGTYPYMAPEQVKGATHRLNARCDIWALGVILYEMLTGRRPFRGETREQLCDEIIERTPAAPRELDRTIPRELNRLCMQCLSKRDADRPHAAADLQDDLVQILKRLGDGSSSTRTSSTSQLVFDTADSTQPTLVVEYPVPTLKRFTAEQAELYLRLMPRSYANADELPELIAYWKQRIVERDSDKTFTVGILVGVSGCGKSSMLEAGLIPALPDSIVPILVEGSESDTEIRILKKLRRALPELDPEKKWSLVDWAFRLRSGHLLPPDRKVVLIVDQFEQWLNAHGGESTNQLLDALHQCDGEHLQAIVCVREGFHATLMRFVQALDLHLDDHNNYATAHRFTPDHARFVLTQFGRGLKRLDDPSTEAQNAFLDATVEGLAEMDRGVVCVRLVVLALVMQDRHWTVEELDRLGGLDGIGSQFLIDCFEGRTASEQYRRYLPAATRVLAELLPAEGLEIKDVRSYDQLLAASELDKLQFDDLLIILTRKLFLLTLVEADTVASPATNNSQLVTNYQLTHDFLVPSIRDWLARKLRETKEGRALLRLQERTAAWTSKPENRNLPSVWEAITIRRLTDHRKWKPKEKTMLQRAGRVHATRAGLLVSAIAIMAILGLVVRRQIVAQQELSRVEGLVAQLVTAEPGQIPAIVRQLDKVPELAQPFVNPLLQLDPETANERRSKLHAQMSTVRRDASMIEPLVKELLVNKVDYIGPIVEVLQPHSADLQVKLAKILRDPQVESKSRFRAGVALAGFMISAADWNSGELTLIANQLVSTNAEYQPALRKNLRPLAKHLLTPIELIFKDANAPDAKRLGAANAITDFASNHGAILTRLLADATPAQYEILYPRVNNNRSAEGIAELQRIAAKLPPADLGSVLRIAYGQRRANAAVSLLGLGEREKVMPVFNFTDDPEAMTQFIFRCRPRGIGVEPLLDLLDIQSQRDSSSPTADITSKAFQQNARARYATLLALGEFTIDEIPADARAALITRLADWYANDPSSGVHGACGWLLRQWGEQDVVSKVDQTPVPYSPDREWFTLAITVQNSFSPTPLSDRKPDNPGENSETQVDTDSPNPNPATDDANTNVEREQPPAQPTPAGTIPPKTFYYTFVVFPAGEFQIGSVEDEPERIEPKEARHTVKLTRHFAVLNREITFAELIAFSPDYKPVMSQFKAKPDYAGFGAHWYDSVAFCRWLGEQAGVSEVEQAYPSPTLLSDDDYPREPNPDANWAPRNWPLDPTRQGFRLPTDAEWEVAARAGTRTSYGYGSDVKHLMQFGWYRENTDKQVHAPQERRPSFRGLFDVHGNLYEWTHDWYVASEADIATDPLGPEQGAARARRGGGWTNAATCRSAFRNSADPAYRTINYGFRIALTLAGASAPSESTSAREAEPSKIGTERAVVQQRSELP